MQEAHFYHSWANILEKLLNGSWDILLFIPYLVGEVGGGRKQKNMMDSDSIETQKHPTDVN